MQTLLLVSHTHWDREWYLTFEQYRARLVATFDKLLDVLDEIPAFHSFTFDGQTIPIDDYLEIRPEMRERLARHVRSGRLLIGPLYVIPAGYTPRGETWVRNFQLGMARCAELGSEPDHVYMAEPTSLPEQWPQIAAGFGFREAVFGRGLRIDPRDENDSTRVDASEYCWEGPEGSRLLVVHMPAAYDDESGARCILHYCNSAEVFWNRIYDPLREQEPVATPDHLDEVLERVGILREYLTPLATSDTLLLMHGCDHLPPQPGTPEFVAAVNERLDGARMVHGSMRDYLDAVKKAGNAGEVRQGESSGRTDAMSRVYLQRLDSDAQYELSRWMEPAAAMALAWRGAPAPGLRDEGVPDMNTGALRRQAWRYVIQNHAHDTIWGAAVDDVYGEVVTRYAKAHQIAEELARESMHHVAEAVTTADLPGGDAVAAVFNPHGHTVDAVVETEFQLPANVQSRHVRVTDDAGVEWPVQVIESHVVERRTDRFRRYAFCEKVRAVKAVVHARSIPPVGYRAVSVSGARKAAETDLRASADVLENEHMRVAVHPDGSFDVVDKRTGVRVDGLNALVDQGDGGHGWRFAPIERDRFVTASEHPGKARLVEAGPVRATVEVRLSLPLPVGLTRDTHGRLISTRVCPVVVRISLAAGSRRVEVSTEIDNRVRNHRLRALFPTGIRAERTQCDGAFGVHDRHIRVTDPTPISLKSGIGYHPSQPQELAMMHSWLDIADEERGMALLTRGLPMYEILNADGGTRAFALTLMRAAIGHTSIHDPDLTHECQVPGPQRAEYAVVLHAGDWLAGEVHREAAVYTSPPRFEPTGRHAGARSTTGSLIGDLPPEIELSALKPADDDESIAVVRLVNLLPEQRTETVAFSDPPQRVDRADLRERAGEPLEVGRDGSVRIEFAPKEIVTLRVAGLAGGG